MNGPQPQQEALSGLAGGASGAGFVHRMLTPLRRPSESPPSPAQITLVLLSRSPTEASRLLVVSVNPSLQAHYPNGPKSQAGGGGQESFHVF